MGQTYDELKQTIWESSSRILTKTLPLPILGILGIFIRGDPHQRSLRFTHEFRTHSPRQGGGFDPEEIGLLQTLAALASAQVAYESGPLRAVHLSLHKWPGGAVN